MMTTTTMTLALGRVRPSEEESLRGFARADLPFDEVWLETLLTQRRRRLSTLFWKCFASTLPTCFEAILLDANRTTWSIAMGQVRRAMLLPHDDHRGRCARRAAIGLALSDIEHGCATSFSVVLDEPHAFLFAGHVLPPARQIACESDGTFTELRLDGEPWRASSRSAQPRITTPRRDVPILASLPFGHPFPEPLAPAKPNEEIRAHFESAFAILGEADRGYPAPIFVPWVARATRALVPVLTPPDQTISSSFEDLPGVIALSHASDAMHLADCLVHEASHQHVQFLQQLGPMDDGSDDTLYWSPARRENRPLEKIVLAYHAFVNILRFWEACRDRGIGDEETCSRMIAHKRHYCEELRKPLETERALAALTRIGRALIDLDS